MNRDTAQARIPCKAGSVSLVYLLITCLPTIPLWQFLPPLPSLHLGCSLRISGDAPDYVTTVLTMFFVDMLQVLAKLLPIVIDQLKSQHDRTRKKVGFTVHLALALMIHTPSHLSDTL